MTTICYVCLETLIPVEREELETDEDVFKKADEALDEMFNNGTTFEWSVWQSKEILP